MKVTVNIDVMPEFQVGQEVIWKATGKSYRVVEIVVAANLQDLGEGFRARLSEPTYFVAESSGLHSSFLESELEAKDQIAVPDNLLEPTDKFYTSPEDRKAASLAGYRVKEDSWGWWAMLPTGYSILRGICPNAWVAWWYVVSAYKGDLGGS